MMEGEYYLSAEMGFEGFAEGKSTRNTTYSTLDTSLEIKGKLLEELSSPLEHGSSVGVSIGPQLGNLQVGSEQSVPRLLAELEESLESASEMVSHLLNGYLTLFAVISGVALNGLCIYVFLKFRRSGTPVIQYYLVTLTLWQTALLCNAFLLYCLPTLIYGHVVSSGNYVFLYPYAYALANTTHTGSVWIVLTLTIDRYLALCQPLTHRAIGKKRLALKQFSRVKKMMMAVSILAVIYSAPRFFEVTTVYFCTDDDGSHQCVPTVARTTLPEDKAYWTVYHIVLAMLCVTLVPCLLLFALTLRISIAIRQASLKRRALCEPNVGMDGRNNNNATCSKKEHKANVMLVLVIAKFLTSDILPTVADVLEHIVGNQVFMSSSLATLFVDVSNFLLVLNCSTNFWVFFFWGNRFRRSCTYLFATSVCGRTVGKWMHVAVDSELANYFTTGLGPPGGSSFTNYTTNYTRTRSRCGSALFTNFDTVSRPRSVALTDSVTANLLPTPSVRRVLELKGHYAIGGRPQSPTIKGRFSSADLIVDTRWEHNPSRRDDAIHGSFNAKDSRKNSSSSASSRVTGPRSLHPNVGRKQRAGSCTGDTKLKLELKDSSAMIDGERTNSTNNSRESSDYEKL